MAKHELDRVMISRRRFLTITGVGLGGALVAACAPSTTGPAPSGPVTAGTASATPAADPNAVITYAAVGDPQSLAPGETTKALDDQQVIHNLFDSLTSFATDMTVRPGLATDWTTSSDGLKWTFKLRKGVQFHDGEPFNADAVKFSFDRLVDTKKPLLRTPVFTPVIKSVSVVDDGTVDVNLLVPFAPLLQILALPAASIVSPKAVQKFGADFGRNPVGTGPFVFDQWVRGQTVSIKRNEKYWGPQAKVKGVTFRAVLEPATRVALLETGEVDLAQQIPPADFKRFATHAQIQPIQGAAFDTRPASFNVLQDKFKDVRVRQAMNYALNVPDVVETILLGGGVFTGGPMPSSMPGALQKTKYHYDPAMAKKLLADAGYPNGFSTVWEYPASVAGSGTKEAFEAFQAQWKAVGINVELRGLDTAADDRFNMVPPEQSQQKEMVGRGYSYNYPDPHAGLYASFHSSQFPPKSKNWGYYKNARVDELLDMGLQERDPAKRISIYTEIQNILVEDAPAVFLYNSVLQYGGKRTLRDVKVLPTEMIHFADVSKAAS